MFKIKIPKHIPPLQFPLVQSLATTHTPLTLLDKFYIELIIR